ncbi:hypothetical protein [Flavobacterium sp.]|uniref:hypothetical protein n=1 Tax=Flavobacterium sp. TaxID=239 RepID=UPI0037513CDD
MEFKGTKGEWKFLDNGTYCEIQREKPLLSICAINMNIEGYEENAKAIAAVPDLIEALQKIIEMNYQNAEDQYGDRNKADGWSCVTVAKKALKKALS